MFTPKFEMTVPLSREDCFNRLQTGLDFSLFKGLRFSSRRRSVLIIIQRQQVAFDRKNINRMRFDLYGHHEIVLGLIIELHFVDMKTTIIIGEVQSFDVFFVRAIRTLFLGTIGLAMLFLGGNALLSGLWAESIIPFFMGTLFFGMLYLSYTRPNKSIHNTLIQVIEYTLQDHTY